MTPLAARLATDIAAEGPITVARFMALALGDPAHGYYATRDPLGAAGDFTTAPEISQVFGELIGLWCLAVWRALGAPAPVHLVELGPGRGTLMRDALRAARLDPAFLAALSVDLVETSPALRARQAATLAGAPVPVAWHERIEEVPPGPALVVANEFLDALPVRQFVRAGTGWHERLVGLDGEGRLAFGLAPEPEPGLRHPAPEGAVLEVGEAALGVVLHLAGRLARGGGAALLIDYGHARSGFGDTLQAVRAHAYADPLDAPGEADLTCHVDFAALARAARAGGAAVHGPVTQGALLRALGIEARREALGSRAGEGRAGVEAGIDRLIGPGPEGMGELFKALALTPPGAPVPPGFEGPT